MIAVMDFMDLRDLREYLARNGRRVFIWDRKCQLLLSVAKGLGYLHSLFIIHRDLKSRNILMDSKKGVKLVDCGIINEDIQSTITQGVGTFRWMAPKMLPTQ
ncbi:hypothetical protein THRCLA_02233 [Thraustotheca clavata]|uniref:Protein kinase domain-containing protein n=1 Tax=Thraustotheca clavata TaxID=74557 RepID=A0A1W0A5V8_9STRA|nr:hypothetical protein THRCLA_02233 [Thraustotheca clavata]